MRPTVPGRRDGRGPAAVDRRTVEAFAGRGITVRLHCEATAIDPNHRVIQVRDVQGGTETTQAYDRLLVATGAIPVIPQVPGLELAGVFGLDVMEDAIALQDYLRTCRPRRAVIVGGGYIGLEMAENLVRLGLQVRLIQRSAQLFPSVDVDIALPLVQELERHGSIS